MSAFFDCLVIGAGPGGLAAAATAAECGMRVALVDDNPAAGGQIWRRGCAQVSTSHPAERWMKRVQRGKVEVLCGWRATDAGSDASGTPYIRVEGLGGFQDLCYSKLILATGARELLLPFPGWTLPGIYGAGGLQAFAKSGFDVRGKRIVLAGTGPLLMAVAAHLHEAGAKIVAVAEQAPMSRLASLGAHLAVSQPGKLMEGLRYRLRTMGTKYYFGYWVSAAHGDATLRRLSVTNGSRSFEIEADMLGIGYHLVPNTELAQLLGCGLEDGYVRVDRTQVSSRKDVYCIGEPTGIGGVDKAQIEGRIAALAAAGKLEDARSLFAARDKQLRFVKLLASAFALREELRNLAKENTLLCRCEDVSHGALRECRSWREAKLHTRCGMGPCQGRICGPATQFLYGWQQSAPRPPLFPSSVATIAGVDEIGIHHE
jgi:NADPH-dependent 2,4-dienoyl-CoA reductase/sulfur reductase-like enzyme